MMQQCHERRVDGKTYCDMLIEFLCLRVEAKYLPPLPRLAHDRECQCRSLRESPLYEEIERVGFLYKHLISKKNLLKDQINCNWTWMSLKFFYLYPKWFHRVLIVHRLFRVPYFSPFLAIFLHKSNIYCTTLLLMSNGKTFLSMIQFMP